MKATCQQENFHQALTIVNRAAPSRTTIQEYLNVLIEAQKDNQIRMMAANNEMSMTVWIPAEVQEPGAITVPVRLINEFVNYLPKETITINTGEDEDEDEEQIKANVGLPRNKMRGDQRLSIECDKARTMINGMPAQKFPSPPRPKNPTHVMINNQEFREAIDAVAFCAATDAGRPILNGVQIKFQEDQFTMAATDGFRLARQRGTLQEKLKNPIEVVIPNQALTELAHIRADSAEPTRMSVSKDSKQIMFGTKTQPPGEYRVEMVSRTLEGTFPNFEALIPKGYSVRATFDTRQLMMCTKSASIFAKDGNQTVVYKIKRNENGPGEETPPTSGEEGENQKEPPGAITIAGKSEDIGDNLAVLDAIEMDGEGMEIGFNSKFLMEALGSLNSSKVSRVILEMQNPSSPGVIKTSDSDDYLHLIMPMFIR